MIVVADTTPINYLVLIDEAALLSVLYDKVFLPPAVITELLDARAPERVRQWMLKPPPWIRLGVSSPVSRPGLFSLDPGEREAIELALDFNIHTLLIDESRARKQARALGLDVQGTLGILAAGARLGRCNLAHAMAKLEATSFRVSDRLRAAVLRGENH